MAKQIKGMVDISFKKTTRRIAVATSKLVLGKKAFTALIEGKSPKGNVLEAAKIAAVMAAKKAPDLIPMCHPLNLNQVLIEFISDEKEMSVTTRAEVNCEGKTGVEMEALTAAVIGSLTIYDMMKWADKGMVIERTQLEFKSGGVSGSFKRKKG